MKAVATPIFRVVFIVMVMAGYTLSMCGSFLPFLNYAVNYRYISTYLCENTNRPQLHCCGKCYVYKQLNNQTKEEQKPQRSGERERTLEVFHIPSFAQNMPPLASGISYSMMYREFSQSASPEPPFMPPRSILSA